MSETSTLYDDVTLLVHEGVHPILIAPDGDSARSIVRAMNRSASHAVHVSGSDAALFPGTKAGIASVRPGLLRTLTDAGYIPVVEPSVYGPILAQEEPGHPDDIARAVASALDASRIIFFHPAGGLHDPLTNEICNELTPAEALAFADDARLDDSLRTTARAAALGVRSGVGAAQIVDSRVAHACVVELITATHYGTQVARGLWLGD